MKMFKYIKNNQGVTLIEVLITGIIASIVITGIYIFVDFSGEKTAEITALMKLQQESSVISEMFMRSIRKANHICVGTSTTAPNADMDNELIITTRDSNGASIDKFEISTNSLKLNDNVYLTSYLCTFNTPASHFKVFLNGKHIEFYLSLYKNVHGRDIYLTQTIGDVRCKN